MSHHLRKKTPEGFELIEDELDRYAASASSSVCSRTPTLSHSLTHSSSMSWDVFVEVRGLGAIVWGGG
jgi:hypothetical protein